MPLNDDQLRALGRISVMSAELDFSTNTLACVLVNQDLNIGRIVFDGEQSDRVLTKVRRLAEEIVARDNKELASRIQQWATKAKNAQQRRNEVLHAVWVKDQLTGQMIPIRMTRQHIPEAQTRATELDRLADELESAVWEASEIFSDIRDIRRDGTD
jgi:hypothetical protein